VKDEVTH